MRVFSFTEDRYNIFKYRPWYIQNQDKKIIIYIKNWKDRKKYFLIQLKNITNRSMADMLKNHYISINENTLPKLQDNNYYWKDIISCTVINIKKKN
ncbi:MAG: ribosome maturation factor RimM [Buchnera aphidicola (Schlechtendalia peitan)]